jgi:beta-lactamase class A
MDHRQIEGKFSLHVQFTLRSYNPCNSEVTLLKRIFCVGLLAAILWGPDLARGQQSPSEKEQILWQKLETTIHETDQHLDGVLAVAILDLSTGQKYLLHADEVLPTASSIKIAILAELFRQAQQGKVKLGDLYTLQKTDIVGGSGIAEALTP